MFRVSIRQFGIFIHFPKLVKRDYAGKINLRNGTKGQIKPKAD